MAIRITPLGAGQHVGRSCILLELDGCRVLLDCGVNVGSRDADHVPVLETLCPDGQNINSVVDVVLVSHYHLDHTGNKQTNKQTTNKQTNKQTTKQTKDLCHTSQKSWAL